ncbi:MAG: hypothetical protein PHD48_12760 [Alphaproteobacteria bacterium]|nr:hypothetical protein [Alphaproteobacteria bacterium]
MPDFHNFIMRHGEFVAQYIIEQIERIEGICSDNSVSLEQRWAALKNEPAPIKA